MFLRPPIPFPNATRPASVSLRSVLPFVFTFGVILGLLVPAAYVHVRQALDAAFRSPLVEPAERLSHSAPLRGPRKGSAIGLHAADVLRTLDGDTFEARVQLWSGLEIRTRVRLRGIDAPELKAHCASEFRKAQASTQALRRLLEEGQVAIFNIGPDKYAGRVVADVSTRKTSNVSKALLAQGHARPYWGGRRESWCGLAAR